eukprot:Gb_25707 [translate_table: standard]
MREENYQIAVQLAALISKIACIDYPRDWPELFSNLAQLLQSSDILTSQRACMTLHQSLKELSTKRLVVDQRNFAEITTQLFDYTWHQWCGDMQLILHEFSSIHLLQGNLFSLEHHQALHLTCERWMLCLKAMRRMIIFGFPSDAKSVRVVASIKDVCPSFLQAIQSLLQCRSGFKHGHDDFRQFTERACLKLMKVLVAIQSTHPYSFCDPVVLSPILDFCYRKITDPEAYIVSFDRFLIHCITLVKAVLECTQYKPGNIASKVDGTVTSMDEVKRSFTRQAENTVKCVVNSERIVLLCNVLVRRYFVFTSKDLDEWARDPEGFHHEQDIIQWTETLRPCAEALYLTMFEKHREVMAPLVIEILKQITNNCQATEVEITSELLLKEAAYTAVGFAHYELSNYLSFKTWFEGSLLIELQNTNSNARIIRRRIAWLLGQWVSEIKDDIRSLAYGALLSLLQDNDLAVKLAACRSLCVLIEDVHLYEEYFVEFVPILFETCFQSLYVFQEFDSKIQILKLLSVIIDQLGGKIVLFANILIQHFPEVWEDSMGENLMRLQIIIALRNFMDALGPQSPICYNILMPILRLSIDANNANELNLLEDGLLLWEATLNHAPSMGPELLELFHYLIGVMEKSFDRLPIAMRIIEVYILLGGEEFLNIHALEVVKILDAIIGNVNHMGMTCTLPIIEILVQHFLRDAPPSLVPILQKLTVMFITGGDAIDPAKEAIRSSIGAILARLLVQNSNYFAYIIAQKPLQMTLQHAGNGVNQNILLSLVDAWLDKVDNVTSIRRKAYGLALCISLTLRDSQILSKLDQILSVCTGILVSDIQQDGNEASSYECLHLTENREGAVPSDFGEMRDFKKRQFESADPIKNMSLSHILRESLQTCASLHGDEVLNAAMSSLHPTLLGMLQQLLKT